MTKFVETLNVKFETVIAPKRAIIARNDVRDFHGRLPQYSTVIM
jgi:hypothetical protein